MANEQVDYAKLSVHELIDVADHVDREAYPEIAAMVDRELASRLTARAQSAETVVVSVPLFDEAIERHLRWRRILFISWLAPLPLEIIVGWPLDKATGSNLPFVLIAFGCMAVFAFSGLMLGLFTCPRCDRPFTRKAYFRNPFSSSCVNCGLTHSR